MAKKRIVRFLRNTLISIGVLLVVVVGGGVAYTWYMGEYSAPPSTAIATPVDVAPRQVITPPKPSPDAPASAAIQMLTSPIVPGTNTSITVKTNVEAECTISVEYNKIPSTDSGLKPKVADEFGMVSWAWTVEESVPLGTWPVIVTCSANDKSAVVKGELVVANKVD